MKGDDMSKIVLAIAVVLMMMATATLTNAEKGSAQTESGATNNAASEATKSDKAVSESSDGGKSTGQKEGREYLIRAWGRYGPVSLAQGWSAYYRIYYPGSFLGQPSVVDSLAVAYPGNIFTIYSLGRDRGYSVNSRFDARLAVHSGSLSGAYIDWVAIRG